MRSFSVWSRGVRLPCILPSALSFLRTSQEKGSVKKRTDNFIGRELVGDSRKEKQKRGCPMRSETTNCMELTGRHCKSKWTKRDCCARARHSPPSDISSSRFDLSRQRRNRLNEGNLTLIQRQRLWLCLCVGYFLPKEGADRVHCSYYEKRNPWQSPTMYYCNLYHTISTVALKNSKSIPLKKKLLLTALKKWNHERKENRVLL